MKIVIDGKIGSGKSYVAKHLAIKYNFKIIDLDQEVHKLYDRVDIQKQVMEVLDIKQFDKAEISDIIFTNSKKKILLEQTIFPYLKELTKNYSGNVIIEGYQALNIVEQYDLGLITCAPKQVREDRVKKRSPQLNFEQIDSIQKSVFYCPYHTYTIQTDEEYFNHLDQIMEEYARNWENC